MHTPVPHALPARVLICNTLKNITDRYARSFIMSDASEIWIRTASVYHG